MWGRTWETEGVRGLQDKGAGERGDRRCGGDRRCVGHRRYGGQGCGEEVDMRDQEDVGCRKTWGTGGDMWGCETGPWMGKRVPRMTMA